MTQEAYTVFDCSLERETGRELGLWIIISRGSSTVCGLIYCRSVHENCLLPYQCHLSCWTFWKRRAHSSALKCQVTPCVDTLKNIQLRYHFDTFNGTFQKIAINGLTAKLKLAARQSKHRNERRNAKNVLLAFPNRFSTSQNEKLRKIEVN